MKRLDDLLTAISIGLNKFGGWVVLPVMTTMMTVDVIMRYVFNAPLSWGLEVSQHLLLLVFVLGMLEAFRTGAHIRMDLFYRMFAPVARRMVSLFYALSTVGVFVLLLRKGWEETWFMKEINQVTQFLHMPLWVFYSSILIATILVIAFFALRALAIIRGQREEVEDAHDPFGIG